MRKEALLCDAIDGVGGDGKWERISERRVESDLPAVEMKMSTSKASFFRRVEEERNINFDLDSCFQNH